MTTVIIVHAGMSEDSSTAQLAHAVSDALAAEADALGMGISTRLIPLRPLARSITDQVLTGFPNEELAEVQDALTRADALVALTPTYQASYSGLFKSFFDVLDADALAGTPVLLGATGGTPRHSLVTEVAMRPLFTYQRADPVPTAIYAATEDWGAHAADSDSSGGDGLQRRIRRGARELLMRVNRPQTEGPVVSAPGPGTIEYPEKAETEADKWPGFTDFEKLMGGI